MVVYPTHGAGSLRSARIALMPLTTIGFERATARSSRAGDHPGIRHEGDRKLGGEPGACLAVETPARSPSPRCHSRSSTFRATVAPVRRSTSANGEFALLQMRTTRTGEGGRRSPRARYGRPCRGTHMLPLLGLRARLSIGWVRHAFASRADRPAGTQTQHLVLSCRSPMGAVHRVDDQVRS